MTDAESHARADLVGVLRHIRLLEAYFPGLREMPAARYVDLARAILESFGASDTDDLILLLPDDEVLLILTRREDNRDADLLANATVQRVVDAYLIDPYDDQRG